MLYSLKINTKNNKTGLLGVCRPDKTWTDINTDVGPFIQNVMSILKWHDITPLSVEVEEHHV